MLDSAVFAGEIDAEIAGQADTPSPSKRPIIHIVLVSKLIVKIAPLTDRSTTFHAGLEVQPVTCFGETLVVS